MPAKYLKIRNECYLRKKKKNNGTLTHKDEMDCKKEAAIVYYKLTGKSVQQADAEIDPKDLPDDIDLQILAEQIDFFGSLEEHLKWQQETNDGDDNEH